MVRSRWCFWRLRCPFCNGKPIQHYGSILLLYPVSSRGSNGTSNFPASYPSTPAATNLGSHMLASVGLSGVTKLTCPKISSSNSTILALSSTRSHLTSPVQLHPLLRSISTFCTLDLKGTGLLR